MLESTSQPLTPQTTPQPIGVEQPAPSQPQQLDVFALPQQPTTPSQPQAQPETYNTPDFQQFNEQFRQYAGVDFKDAVITLNEVRQWRAQQQVQQQETQLRSMWNVDDNEFSSRLQAVKQRFSQLPPEVQRLYDNPEGAALIWQRLELESGLGNVPSLDRSTVNSPSSQQGRYQFRQSDINKMSSEEYANNADAIMRAYASGQVLRDI